MAQARLGSYGLAESYYRKAVEAAGATPDAALAHTDLAFLLLLGNDTGRAEEALRCAREAAKLNPSSPEAHYLAGKALFKLKRLPQAVGELREAEKLNPDEHRFYGLTSVGRLATDHTRSQTGFLRLRVDFVLGGFRKPFLGADGHKFRVEVEKLLRF
jgi:tetratricopeptide (TPR) repeat protein